MKSETVLLFDLGGVLVETSGIQALHALLPHISRVDEVLTRWHTSCAVADFERGRTTPECFAGAFIEEWALDLSEAAFLRAFAAWVHGFFPGAKALLDALRPRYRLACLSNTNAIHWARLQGIEDLFDHTFASYRSGFMKPDRRAYEDAMTALNVSSRQVHFFDDLHPNIDAARALGINAYRVAGPTEVRAALQAAGLL